MKSLIAFSIVVFDNEADFGAGTGTKTGISASQLFHLETAVLA
jgi:hypothetical protein